MLSCDLKLEHLAVPLLREAIIHCESVKDFVSRDLFTAILESEEEHIDWLETQLELIEKIGIQNYLQSQM
jgi:bacterioferritin